MTLTLALALAPTLTLTLTRWSVILHLRLLFCGQPASAVGNCCLAAPLLVAPLQVSKWVLR